MSPVLLHPSESFSPRSTNNKINHEEYDLRIILTPIHMFMTEPAYDLLLLTKLLKNNQSFEYDLNLHSPMIFLFRI